MFQGCEFQMCFCLSSQVELYFCPTFSCSPFPGYFLEAPLWTQFLFLWTKLFSPSWDKFAELSCGEVFPPRDEVFVKEKSQEGFHEGYSPSSPCPRAVRIPLVPGRVPGGKAWESVKTLLDSSSQELINLPLACTQFTAIHQNN